MFTASITTKAEPADEKSIEANALQDPHPVQNRFVGKRLSFNVAGRRVAGTCLQQTYIGRTKRGDIPNYKLLCQLENGHSVTVNMVEQYTFLR